ncbi:olfactory receptor 52D1-like [Pseudoliparis swirei]|uniref:olfactory receptor 52D1-like n=1 Tax=Pseudoliparis swirei TaxID=2059687 RepID=UPI0024BD6157|nr:olfactory receptor 52D1-like [Pseudoliparis swirei]
MDVTKELNVLNKKLQGLNETNNYRFVLFSLTLLCYCFIVLGNVALIVTIILDKNMHEPMYILLCTFCMNGLYGTTGFYPKMLWDLLSPVHGISYYGCLVQSFVILSFICCDLSILSVMAYDRYVAICRPLEYHSIMSKQRVLLRDILFDFFNMRFGSNNLPQSLQHFVAIEYLVLPPIINPLIYVLRNKKMQSLTFKKSMPFM